MFTSKEIRDHFKSSTRGVRTNGKRLRYVTREMMERDEITQTIKKVRKGLPTIIIATSTHRLRKHNSVSE